MKRTMKNTVNPLLVWIALMVIGAFNLYVDKW